MRLRHALVLTSLLGLAAPFPCHAAGPQPASAGGTMTVYVGTYTDAGSRGIYRLAFDPAKATLGTPVLAGASENPSFLALHPNGRVLYAANEVDRFGGRPSGAVSAFSIDPATGDLTLLNQQASEGGGPCHLTVDRAGRNLLVANYGSGTVAVLPIETDGRLRPASSVQQHRGSGPNKARQAGPHAHGVYFDPAGRFLLASDLGADRIFVYAYDAAKGTLTPHGEAALAPGSGPRHLAFDPSGRHVYAIDELASTITVLDYDATSGALRTVQSVPTVPAGFTGTNTTAEVAVSPDGRFVYGSNRGEDTIVVFSVDKASGQLTPAGRVPAGGKTPRHFALDPAGRFLVVAHQDSGSLASFRLDAGSGVPAPSGGKAAVSKAVCVLFAPAR